MKRGHTCNVIYKEVVVVGNGPSAIALSYMLAGNLPYLISSDHPDELLAARLQPILNQNLIDKDLSQVAGDLEGRSTNPVSLLLDALLHPCADIGIEMEPLVDFRKTGTEIDHIVLGKGPPGGSWHTMDPYILTLSLGTWMSLPGLPFYCRDSGEKRAYACNVAKYYENYVKEMNLTKYFKNGVLVTNTKLFNPKAALLDQKEQETDVNWVKRIDENERTKFCVQPEINKQENKQRCLISNALNYFWSKGNNKRSSFRCCRRLKEFQQISESIRKSREMNKKEKDHLPSQKSLSKRDKSRSISLSSDSSMLCDNSYNNKCVEKSFNSYSLRNSYSLDFNFDEVPAYCKTNVDSGCCDLLKRPNWAVEAYNVETGERTVYTCKYLVLANGCSDLPNRLKIDHIGRDPDWLMHDLRALEYRLDQRMEENFEEAIDPVVIVGAGLSAADAIIAIRGRNIPVIHVFRNKSADLNKQLPENMYPEYHKVHQMMVDGGSSYPLYQAYPEFIPTGIDDASHSVILTSKFGEQLKIRVSYMAVLIGSSSDLSFLPEKFNVAVKPDLPIEGKSNTIDINRLTHRVNGFDYLYAVGPPAGDNFVRFLPGGGLACVSDIYKREKIGYCK